MALIPSSAEGIASMQQHTTRVYAMQALHSELAKAETETHA
jgi:hypothetical protein